MRSGRASRTAEHNALFRGLESSIPDQERLFDDPFAWGFVTRPLSLVRLLAAMPAGGRVARSVIDGRWPGVRTSVAARTRLIDDTLSSLPSERLTQLVLLGSGFDSRPYRLDRLEDVQVFEVDHPDTQHAKRRALARAHVSIPSNVVFVPTDFNLIQLDADILAAGYRPTAPTTILWEGVTNYLSPDAVDATMRWCGRAAPDSSLLFTYVHIDALTHPEKFRGADRMHATLAKVGEQLTFGIDPADVPEYLTERGLVLEWDLGASEYRSRFYGAKANDMTGHEFYRVAMARVADE